MVSVADDDHHVSIIVYFHVASTVSISSPSSATAQSSSTLSSPPTGEHVLSAGVYMLVHNVDVCTAGTDTVSRFQFMEAVASKIPSKWKRVGVSLGMDQSQLDAINMRRLADPLEPQLYLMCSHAGSSSLLHRAQPTGPLLSLCYDLTM